MTLLHTHARIAALIAVSALTAGAVPADASAQETTVTTRSAKLDKPTGWLGIHYSAEAKIDETAEGLRISYNSYPIVEAIEPGSPAERSGLEAGDTLIAFNGYDFVRRGVPMARLVRPGERLAIRVKRNKYRTVRLTVGSRPPGVFGFRMRMDAQAAGGSDDRRMRWTEQERAGAPRAANRAVATVMPVQPAPREALLAEEMARATVRALEREVVMHPSVAPLMAFRTPSGAMLIAGAEMVPVNPQLGDVLGVRKGVLLVNVHAATPAQRSGLRAGDVVVRAGASEVTEPADLHTAMAHAGPARTLQMEVVRKSKSQRILLRW